MLLGPQAVTAMSYHSCGLLRSRASVASFQEWKAEEAGWREGKKRGEDLAEYATLALRLNPAVVSVDNQSSLTCSRLCVDSANRPGTLIEVSCSTSCSCGASWLSFPARSFGGSYYGNAQVVQYLLGLGLCVQSATISSDRSWFYDGKGNPYPVHASTSLPGKISSPV